MRLVFFVCYEMVERVTAEINWCDGLDIDGDLLKVSYAMTKADKYEGTHSTSWTEERMHAEAGTSTRS